MWKKTGAVIFVIVGSVGLLFLEPISMFLYNGLTEFYRVMTHRA